MASETQVIRPARTGGLFRRCLSSAPKQNANPYPLAIQLIHLFGNKLSHIELVQAEFSSRSFNDAYSEMLHLYDFLFKALKNQTHRLVFKRQELVTCRLERRSFSCTQTDDELIDEMLVETGRSLYDTKRLRLQDAITLPDRVLEAWRNQEHHQAGLSRYLYRTLTLPMGALENIPDWVYENLFSTGAFLYKGAPYYWGDLVLSWGKTFEEQGAMAVVDAFFEKHPYPRLAKQMVGEVIDFSGNYDVSDGMSFNHFVIFWTIHTIEDTLKLKLPEPFRLELITAFSDEQVRQDVSFALAFPMKLLTSPSPASGVTERLVSIFRILLNLIYGHIRSHHRKYAEMETIVYWISQSNQRRVGGVLKHSYPFFVRCVINKLPMDRPVNPKDVVPLVAQLEPLYKNSEAASSSAATPSSNEERFAEWAFSLLTLALSLEDPYTHFTFIMRCSVHPLMPINTDGVIDFCTQKGHKIWKGAASALEQYCRKTDLFTNRFSAVQLIRFCERNKRFDFARIAKQMLAFCRKINRDTPCDPTVSEIMKWMRSCDQDTATMTVAAMEDYRTQHEEECPVSSSDLDRVLRASTEKGCDLNTMTLDDWNTFWRHQKPESREHTATLLYELMHKKGLNIQQATTDHVLTYVREQRILEEKGCPITPIAFEALCTYCREAALPLDRILIFDLPDFVGIQASDMIEICKRQGHEFWLDDEQQFFEAVSHFLPPNLSGPSLHFFQLLITRFSSPVEERVTLVKEFAEELAKVHSEETIESDAYFQALLLVTQKKLPRGIARVFRIYEKCYRDRRLTPQTKIALMLQMTAAVPKAVEEQHIEYVMKHLEDLAHRHHFSAFQHLHLFYELIALQNKPEILSQNCSLVVLIENLIGRPMITESVYRLLIYHPDLSKTELEEIFHNLARFRQVLILQEATRPIVPFEVITELSERMAELTCTSGLMDTGRITKVDHLMVTEMIGSITFQISTGVLFPMIQHLTSSFPTGVSAEDELEFAFGDTHHALLPLHPAVETGKMASGHWRMTRENKLVYRFSIVEQNTLTTFSGEAPLGLTLAQLRDEPELLSVLRKLCWFSCIDTAIGDIHNEIHLRYDELKDSIDTLELFLAFYQTAEAIWKAFEPANLSKEDLAPAVFTFLRDLKVLNRQALIHLATKGKFYLPATLHATALQEASAKMHIVPISVPGCIPTFSTVPTKVISHTSHLFSFYAVVENVNPAVEAIMTAEDVRDVAVSPLSVTPNNHSPLTLDVTVSSFSDTTEFRDLVYKKLHEDESEYRLEGKKVTLKTAYLGNPVEVTISFAQSDFEESSRVAQCLRWLYARLKAEFYRVLLQEPPVDPLEEEASPLAFRHSLPIAGSSSDGVEALHSHHHSAPPRFGITQYEEEKKGEDS